METEGIPEGTTETEQTGQVQVYFGDFATQNWNGKAGRAQLEEEFGIVLDADVNMLFAYYNYENCSGSAYVLFAQDGQLLEVVGSHCSCYGLDGQWEPSVVTPEAARLTLSGSMNYYLDGSQEATQAALAAVERFEQSQHAQAQQGSR